MFNEGRMMAVGRGATVSSAIDNIPPSRIYPTGIPIGCTTDKNPAGLLAEGSSSTYNCHHFDWFDPFWLVSWELRVLHQIIARRAAEFLITLSPSYALTDRLCHNLSSVQ